ncbi:MAG: MBL fold metallo-hydrolase [Bacillota bacterium]|nr:MBL fold metallo-hydrolase [Bacillota bacterium]
MKDKILNTKLAEGQIAIFYTGQEGFIIKALDKYILIDGYLSDYVDKNCGSEKVKWVRKYGVPIKGEELDFIDYVFCTHAHYDHADPSTLKAIDKVNKKVTYIVPAAIEDKIRSYGLENIILVKADEEINLNGIKVKAIPSAHEEINLDENGNCKEMGYIFNFGNITLYHAGDCCIYKGLAERLEGVDVAMLPINGRDYFRYNNHVIGNMDTKEAILLAEAVGIKMIIPMHFDLYEVNAVNPAYFVDCITKSAPDLRFHIFVPGEKYILD